jgi:hypothetical protein
LELLHLSLKKIWIHIDLSAVVCFVFVVVAVHNHPKVQ